MSAGDTRIRVSFLARRGMAMALDLLAELEALDSDEDGLTLADACQLEAEYRNGRPFRNIVHERLQLARRAGSEAEYGFCALLCEVVTLNAQGMGATIHGLKAAVRAEVADA